MNEVLRLAQVDKAFRGVPVLRDVELEVHEGECLAITGPNGSGKSVLLRLMCRLMRPDRGEVAISERYLAPGKTFPQDFGIVIDRPGYQAGLTGYENLEALARIRKVVGKAEILAAMGQVGLDPRLRQKAGRYSLGMKQKLALAQAIMEGQRVLLLDEPFNALDEAAVHRVRELLRGLLAEGRTIVFCSHNKDDIDALATRVVSIQESRVVAR